jgi:hypothetical protein
LPLLVDFMVETYIRPTDVKVLKHEDIRLVEKSGITFVVLEHEKTKLHKKNMVSTERGLIIYQEILEYQKRNRTVKGFDYLFLPKVANRDTALQNLSSPVLCSIGERPKVTPESLAKTSVTRIAGRRWR